MDTIVADDSQSSMSRIAIDRTFIHSNSPSKITIHQCLLQHILDTMSTCKLDWRLVRLCKYGHASASRDRHETHTHQFHRTAYLLKKIIASLCYGSVDAFCFLACYEAYGYSGVEHHALPLHSLLILA